MSELLFNRTKKCFKVIKLPKTLPNESYGVNGCCDSFMVLAGGTEDWQNDVNSAFIKLYSLMDSCTFVLKNDEGQNTTYQPVKKQFPNDELSYYATVDWKSVLSSDGIGCYTIEVNYNISGNIGTIVWGEYKLQEYSADNAKMTIRLKGIFNQVNGIENINFSGSNLVDTIRFRGYFGKRQPNTQIDNLIMRDKSVINVRRENQNIYEMNSDGITINYTRKIIDFFLLSESELYISEHHPLNHTSEYKNLPVSIEETPQLEYLEFSKFAKINAKFNDFKRDQLTRFM